MRAALENILIAEDDKDDFEILREAIVDAGFAVVIERAADGEVLLRVLGLNIPDLLFLDIHMPCKDGKQCLKEIRENPRYDALPVIMYTSFNSQKDVEYCYRQRANLYTLKPSSYDDLQKIIQQIFSIDWKRASYYPPLTSFVLGGGPQEKS
jgi:CheY-like chemotaxis protein